MNRDELLKRITALDFYIIDMHLYLNTHPTDRDALAKYNSAVSEVKELRELFTEQYGMLLANNTVSKYPWQWINNPWPWQRSYNFLLGDEK